ncbi:MAG: hypothetical protein AAGA30_04140, partial [Planctomycetota bacterium]
AILEEPDMNPECSDQAKGLTDQQIRKGMEALGLTNQSTIQNIERLISISKPVDEPRTVVRTCSNTNNLGSVL